MRQPGSLDVLDSDVASGDPIQRLHLWYSRLYRSGTVLRWSCLRSEERNCFQGWSSPSELPHPLVQVSQQPQTQAQANEFPVERRSGVRGTRAMAGNDRCLVGTDCATQVRASIPSSARFFETATRSSRDHRCIQGTGARPSTTARLSDLNVTTWATASISSNRELCRSLFAVRCSLAVPSF
jgi:hypothetical protein